MVGITLYIIKMAKQKTYKGGSSYSNNMIPSNPYGLLDDKNHASSPRYDSSEECRDSYSLAFWRKL